MAYDHVPTSLLQRQATLLRRYAATTKSPWGRQVLRKAAAILEQEFAERIRLNKQAGREEHES